MLAKRIIPCLDVQDGKVVKGINFIGIKEVGDPVECAIEYDKQGADEIVFLDITATHEGRGTMLDVVRRTAKNVFVPLTVGGGIRIADDFRELLLAGADKVSVNSAAIRNPAIISEAASRFGNQCVVVAIDGKKTAPDKYNEADGISHASLKRTEVREFSTDENFLPMRYNVFVNGGRIDTGLDVVQWAMEAEKLGAGEILLTSMDADGTKQGFDIDMLNAVCAVVNIPVIASGGCGQLSHFTEMFQKTSADAALAASIFHYGELTVNQVKMELEKNSLPVRRLE